MGCVQSNSEIAHVPNPSQRRGKNHMDRARAMVEMDAPSTFFEFTLEPDGEKTLPSEFLKPRRIGATTEASDLRTVRISVMMKDDELGSESKYEEPRQMTTDEFCDESENVLQRLKRLTKHPLEFVTSSGLVKDRAEGIWLEFGTGTGTSCRCVLQNNCHLQKF
jgi:hypothetical protein